MERQEAVRRGTRAIAAIAAAIEGAGCFASPPLRVGLGGGGAAGTVVVHSASGPRREAPFGGLGQARVAFTPLALRSSTHRRFDLSLGGTLDWTTLGAKGHGFRSGSYLEGVWFARYGRGSAEGWRGGPTLQLEIDHRRASPDGPELPQGYGAAAGVLIEVVDARRSGARGSLVRGDLGVGLAARVGVRAVAGEVHAYAVVSFEARLPGVLAIWMPRRKERLGR